jgi:hypothetical protein
MKKNCTKQYSENLAYIKNSIKTTFEIKGYKFPGMNDIVDFMAKNILEDLIESKIIKEKK